MNKSQRAQPFSIEPESLHLGELALIQMVFAESERRAIRVTPLEVIQIEPCEDNDSSAIIHPGSIVVVLAKHGGDWMQRIRRNPAGDTVAIEKLLLELKPGFEHRERMNLDVAVRAAITSSVLTDIRSGSKPLANNIPVFKDPGVTVLTFPYNGGPLPKAGFTLVQKYKNEESIEGIAIVRPPKLSPIEKAAMEKLRDWELELNVGPPSLCWALTAVTIAATVVLATSFCPKKRKLQTSIPPLIEPLDPTATAVELLARRRRMIEALR